MLRSTFLALSIALPTLATPSLAAEAIFAGGCFWCIEKDFEHVNGVSEVVSGYTGGTNANPTYKNHGKYKHREVVRITYDDKVVSYDDLLNIFFRTVDPTDAGGQFCDRGHSYTTAIYALNGNQLEAAQKAKAKAAKDLGKEVVTPIEMAQKFTEAEGYHQDYYKKNPVRYNYYRTACRRNATVKALWGDAAYPMVDKST